MNTEHKESKEEYEAHMNELALKVSTVLDGEEIFDAASVTAACCAWACYNIAKTPEDRRRVLIQMIKFMVDQLANMEESEGTGRLWSQ